MAEITGFLHSKNLIKSQSKHKIGEKDVVFWEINVFPSFSYKTNWPFLFCSIPYKIFHVFNCLYYCRPQKKKPPIHSSKPQWRGKMGFEWSESRAPGLLRSCTGTWHRVYKVDFIWHNPVALSTELEFHCATGLTNQGEGQHRKPM